MIRGSPPHPRLSAQISLHESEAFVLSRFHFRDFIIIKITMAFLAISECRMVHSLSSTDSTRSLWSFPYLLGCFAGTQQGPGWVCNYWGWDRNSVALSPGRPVSLNAFWDSWWCLAKINKIFHQETWEQFPQEVSNH